MVEAPIKQIPDDTDPGQISWKPSELLTNYERLLKLCSDELRKDEFNPYQSIPRLFLKAFSWSYQRRLWKGTPAFFDVPNTLRQELSGGFLILQELERLNDQTLRAVAECNHINHRRLLQRSAIGMLPTITAVLGLAFAAIRTIMEFAGTDMVKQFLATDVFAAFLSAVWPMLVGSVVGLLLGTVGNLLITFPLLLLVRALDDLIAIAAAHRGIPKPE